MSRLRVLVGGVVVVLLVGVVPVPGAHAGVEGELDAFGRSLATLASATADLAEMTTEQRRPGSTASLIRPLERLHMATVDVAATGTPVSQHLIDGRLTPGAAHEALRADVLALAEAVGDLATASGDLTARLWRRPVDVAAATPGTGALVAPAIQALAGALDTLAPALDALAPVVEPLSPALGPACGRLPGVAFLGIGLLPALLPLPSLPESPAVLAGSVLAPVFLLCAALPTTAPGAPEADDEPPPGPPSTGASPPAPALAAVQPPRPGAPGQPIAAPTALSESRLAAAVPRIPEQAGGAQAGPSRSTDVVSAAAPRPLASMPLLPVDHAGEATLLTLLVVLAGAAAGAVTWLRRRRSQGLDDWAVPGATAAGVGAVAAGAMAWNGAAEQVAPWAQVPYLISGGLTALVLGLVALTLALARPLGRLVATRS